MLNLLNQLSFWLNWKAWGLADGVIDGMFDGQERTESTMLITSGVKVQSVETLWKPFILSRLLSALIGRC